MNSPVLFLIFNRFKETAQSFETIRKAKPPRLYIAADGPRTNLPGELEVCNSVRAITSNVDWDCEIYTLFRDDNLGCKGAIVSAINWFFTTEEQGIILEDDIIPNQEFFLFCDTLLNKYRDNPEIKAINGFNQFGQEVVNNSYFFSRGFYPWGWATWKSRWENYKSENIDISRLHDNDIKNIYHEAAIEGIRFNLKLIEKGILDTWDYQMVYMIMSEKGYVVTPYANLTTNVGVNGAHSINNQNIFFKYGVLEMDNLSHPAIVDDNKLMNEQLWQEYKEAYPKLRIKSLLYKLNFYLPLRLLYKKLKKYSVILIQNNQGS